MLRLVFYIVLLILLTRALSRLWRGFVEGMTGRRPGTSVPTRGVEMVRDPVCGTFVVPDRAVSALVGHERLYFCSATCRDKYRTRTA